MLEIFLLSLGLISIGIAFIAIRLYFGKRFVHTHIDGNKAVNKLGIHCVQSMDADERRKNPHAVSERTPKTTEKKD